MKKYLENNKIYIETFSYIFLGIASIIVAFMSWKTSDKQLKILKLEHQPIINLQRDYKGPFELVIIENVGYHLFEPVIDVNSYYDISLDKYNSYKLVPVYFRVSDYYDFVSVTDNTTGSIATIYSSEYSDKERKRITKEFYNHPDYLKYRLNLKTIVKVKFNDENKNTINKYYLIDIFSIIEISKIKYDEIFNILKNSYFNGRNKSIKEINALELIELAKKKLPPTKNIVHLADSTKNEYDSNK